MYLKKIGLVLLTIIVLSLFMTVVDAAPLDTLQGWRIEFKLNKASVHVGAIDLGSCFVGSDPQELKIPCLHLGIGPFGSTTVAIYSGSWMPMAETIVMWNSSEKDIDAVLTWQWQNYDFAHQCFVVGRKPAKLNVHLTFISDLLMGPVISMDPNGGSMKLKFNGTKKFCPDRRITLAVIPTGRTSNKK